METGECRVTQAVSGWCAGLVVSKRRVNFHVAVCDVEHVVASREAA